MMVGIVSIINQFILFSFLGKDVLKAFSKNSALLDISIDGCMICLSVGNICQKSLKEVTGLKIDGCMHPLPKINGCSYTHRTRSNKVPV